MRTTPPSPVPHKLKPRTPCPPETRRHPRPSRTQPPSGQAPTRRHLKPSGTPSTSRRSPPRRATPAHKIWSPLDDPNAPATLSNTRHRASSPRATFVNFTPVRPPLVSSPPPPLRVDAFRVEIRAPARHFGHLRRASHGAAARRWCPVAASRPG